MSKLKIAFDELETAMSGTAADEVDWYLDRNNGEVIPISTNLALDGEDEECPDWHKKDKLIAGKVETDPSAFLLIEPPTAEDDFGAMTEFVAGLKDGAAKEQLQHALQADRPFKQFRDRLANHAAVQAAWFTFKEKWLKEFMLDWLDSNEIDAELVVRHPSLG
jgi:hypothetical protein